MIHDGLTNPFSGKHMAQEASEVAAEFEMTRADMDKWALRSHERAIAATDEGRLRRGDRPRHDQGQEGRHGRRGRRVPAPRGLAGGAGQAAPDLHQGRHRTRPATRRASTTAPARWWSPPTSGREANGKEVLAEIVAQAAVANDFPYLGHDARRAPR